jgi:DNA-binding CsgD family transcriptional regulator
VKQTKQKRVSAQIGLMQVWGTVPLVAGGRRPILQPAAPKRCCRKRRVGYVHARHRATAQERAFMRPAECAPAAAHNPPCPRFRLTRRQKEVFALVCEGLTNKHICRRLNIAQPTVKAHVSAILRAIGVSNRVEAVLWAVRVQPTALGPSDDDRPVLSDSAIPLATVSAAPPIFHVKRFAVSHARRNAKGDVGN